MEAGTLQLHALDASACMCSNSSCSACGTHAFQLLLSRCALQSIITHNASGFFPLPVIRLVRMMSHAGTRALQPKLEQSSMYTTQTRKTPEEANGGQPVALPL